jgi:proline iminopeptidase
MVEHYPAVEPYESGLLDVRDGHRLYWESVGKPAGVRWCICTVTWEAAAPQVPGSTPRLTGRCCSISAAAVAAVRWPAISDADLPTNTTWWPISSGCVSICASTGGWSSASRGGDPRFGLCPGTFARVAAMVLAAVTAGTRREIEWIIRDMGRIFPCEWDAFTAVVPAAERGGDLSAAYARLLADPIPLCARWQRGPGAPGRTPTFP